MNQRVGKIRNIRTLKALRGEEFVIDLGSIITGNLTSWMKKDPNDLTYRSFEIVGNRYLVLSKDKTSDYYDSENVIVERIAGKWYFDVELIEEGEEENTTIYTGTILFINDVTGSEGYEVTNPSTYIAEYTLSLPDGNGNISLLRNGIVVENTIPLSEYTKRTEFENIAFSGDYADLINTPQNTSDFLNNGSGGGNPYVTEEQLLLSFTFEQSIPSIRWVVIHPLNRMPATSIVDSSGSLVFGKVTYVDINTLIIDFNSQFSGYVYLT
jgi:hypothetical protein